MSRRFILAALAVALTIANHTLAQPLAEAFGTLPIVSSPSLSPDGKHLAIIQVHQGRPSATIVSLDNPNEKPVGVDLREGFIVNVQWANNERLLVTINVNAQAWGDDMNAWYRMMSVDTKGANFAVMFSNLRDARAINYQAAIVSDLDLDDPDHIYMPLYDQLSDLEFRSTMYRVDVNTGNAERVLRGGTNTLYWIMDGHGHILGRVDETKHPLKHHLQFYTDHHVWQEVEKVDASGGEGLGISGLTEDGTAMVKTVVDSKIRTSGLIAQTIADGKSKDLFFDPKYDIADVLKDPWTGRVIGVSVIGDQKTDRYFDPALQTIQKGLDLRFASNSAHAVSWDLSRHRIVVAVDGPRSPTTYYLVDMNERSVMRLGGAYADLQASDLGEVRPYSYKARDGLDIPAYLTLPPGRAPKNLPVVIMPHGGPTVRDDMSFGWETQFLANRGYAVLQPNFRGSGGYGKAFEEAGYGQWGLKMQDDVTDGVQKLIADGIADPKRICIVGGSYGGYAALAGATFTPDLYACAASWAGVSDLRHFLSTESKDYGRDSWMISTWTRYIGDRRDDSDKLDAASPAENAAKIKCPVLLMHGSDDATVRIDQSEQMERALRRAGKQVTFIRIEKETHYMQTSATRTQWLTELEKFLKKNIGN